MILAALAITTDNRFEKVYGLIDRREKLDRTTIYTTNRRSPRVG